MSERAALAHAALAGLLLAAAGCKRTQDDAGGAPSAEPPRSVSTTAPALPTAVSAEPSASAAPRDCCMGKNPCRGKGGCAVPESHACKGKNACAGQGGCRAHCPR